MKFNVTIEETISQTFEIEAETEEQAMALAERKYSDGDIVLDNAQVTERLMSADGSDWREF